MHQHVEGYGYRGRGRGRGGHSQLQCQVCNRFGHTAIQCYHHFNQYYNPTTPPQPTQLRYNPYTYIRPQQPTTPWPPQALVVPQLAVVPATALMMTAPQLAQPSFFGDTAASTHVTNNPQNIQVPMATHDTPSQVFVGNERGLKVHSSGSTSFPSPFNPNIKLHLHNLLGLTMHTKSLWV